MDEENAEKQYSKHQRDYSLLGASVMFRAFHGELMRDFYGFDLDPYFTLVRDDLLYHFTTDEDSHKRAQVYLEKIDYSSDKCKEDKVSHDALLRKYKFFLEGEHEYNEEYFKKLFYYFEQLLPFILVAIEVPEVLDRGKWKDIYDTCMKVRLENEDVYKVGFDALDSGLRFLEQKHKLTNGILGYLTNQEFSDFLKDGKIKDVNLEKRKKFVLVKQANDSEEIFYDPEKLTEFNLEENINLDILEIRGTAAFKGLVSGKVRIIHKVEDASRLKEGEVLVTAMTDPRYVPFMKKACAIVTNEGGVTCHAAIVSRELKKPCVIGTKISTQALKDGDLVNVDANNGVIKILDSHNQENI